MGYTNFNNDWLFIHCDSNEYMKTGYDDCEWEKITLPHDWSIKYAPNKESLCGGGGGYAEAGISWYRKHFSVNDVCGRKYIYFEGIYMDSAVYVNGIYVGGHEYGYSSFAVDVTEALVSGENVVAVRVDNSHQPNSRWYTGSGIYRNTWFVEKEDVHFSLYGVRCHTNGIYEDYDRASLQINAFITNDSKRDIHAVVRHRLYDHDNNLVSNSGAVLHLAPGMEGKCSVRPEVMSPILWKVDNPYLYTLRSELEIDGRICDTNECRIGIRTATFDPDEGFLLNGKTTKIKGMCLHHDCGLTGAVGYESTLRRRLMLLKDMGCNGIRCSHNIPSVTLLDLCDEMGFLVMDEAFDEWMLGKNKNENYYSENCSFGISQFFNEKCEDELKIMLHRDYNHPSVILWSIGNEIPEQSSIEGVSILKRLRDICHAEDPSRKVTAACDNIASIAPYMTLREFENGLDVVGYNYVGRWRERAETFYEEDRTLFPKRCMIGSENPSVGGVRGDYSSEGFFGNYITRTLGNEGLWRYTLSHQFVAGDYLWTGIDYLGETRWPHRGAPFAPIDTAGFKKDAFYYFRSIWNEKDVTLHILPHWNHAGKEGEFLTVICYTNCDEVELFINGKRVAKRGYCANRYGATKAWNDAHNTYATTNDLHLTFDVPYEPGALLAVGYKNGEEVAREIVETTGATKDLKVEIAESNFVVGEPIHVEISAVDEKGREVPDEAMAVSCTVTGNATLLGMDAGDLADLSVYSNNERKMLAGKLMAMVMPTAAGEISLNFTGDNGICKNISVVVP